MSHVINAELYSKHHPLQLLRIQTKEHCFHGKGSLGRSQLEEKRREEEKRRREEEN
jgi:hypothetical protein|tara:strand:- start:255 stop:422 length:168 start_codon:yes stop_codon:yes gene_type:complete